MELFKVICVTCHAKLSVRNESLIGQIVGCPRCGSMVEVAPSSAESAPITASAESTINLPARQAPEPAEAESLPAAASEEAALAEATRAALEASAAVARYKVIVWSAASFFIGAAVVGVVLLRRSDSTTELPSTMPSHAESLQAQLPDELTAESPTSPTFVEPLEEVEERNPAEPEIEVPPIAEDVVDTESIEPVEAKQFASATPTNPAPEETPAVTVEPAPRLARRFDPLDFDLESFSLDSVDHPSAVAEPEEVEAVEKIEKVAREAPAELPVVRRGPQDGADAGQRDAAKQLKLVIPAVQLDQVPLVDSIRLFSQLSGVPMSVAPDQLMIAGITAKKKVSLAATDTSLGEMLTQVLDSLQMEFVARDEQVVVRRKDATKIREINYPVDDLLSADTSEEELAGWVEQLIAPGTWQASGGEGSLQTSTGSLQISQTQQVQYQVLILLERLRLARGLPPRSRYPVKRLAGTPANMLLESELSSTTTFTFSHYTAIDEIFIHWQTELGVPLLVDWPSLAKKELWPQTTIACSVIEEPWSVALGKVLEPLELGWRATTGGAIEITSADKAQEELQLEVIPLSKAANGVELVEHLRSLTEKRAADPSGALLYDAVGRALLSLQPATVQRAIHEHLRERALIRD